MTGHALLPTRRGPDLGVFPGLHEAFDADWALRVFRRSCFNRAFEMRVAEELRNGTVRVPTYLSAGQEQIAAAIADALGPVNIFAQHRAHSYYLSFGGDAGRLVDELLSRETGCVGGRGGSASIHDPAIGMWGHSGHMGDQVPICVGFALATQTPCLTVVGDASGEEDYALAAMGFAATKRLPILFVCEDNDRSILTPVSTRRSWALADVAETFGMRGVEITDDPWLIAHHVRALKTQLPAYLNIHTCRALWHAGAGCDGPPEWDRHELTRQRLAGMGVADRRDEIERAADAEVAALWNLHLAAQ
jgi:pyruvate dehydrogenase E1 component alpha subunit